MITERYFLSQDRSCHWYVIPISKQTQWLAWNNIDEDNPEAWDAPEWADMVGGSYSRVTFENYIIE